MTASTYERSAVDHAPAGNTAFWVGGSTAAALTLPAKEPML